MKRLKRVYHPHNKWEEIKFNMWGDVSDVKAWLKKVVAFTGDHELYGSYMTRVVNEWEFSCENALTDQYINKKAWIGHAAAAWIRRAGPRTLERPDRALPADLCRGLHAGGQLHDLGPVFSRSTPADSAPLSCPHGDLHAQESSAFTSGGVRS